MGDISLLNDSDFNQNKVNCANYANRSLDKHLQAEQITEHDYLLIREFAGEVMAYRDIGRKRVNKLVFHLTGWRRFIGPYSDNLIGDLLCGINDLHDAKSPKGRPYKQNTIRDYITILKQFYTWLIENNYSDIPLGKVKKIRVPPKDRMTKTAADMLSPGEVERIIEAAESVRDKAIITTLYEGGFRIGEIRSLKWGALVFDEHGVVANVNFKTNKPRYIRLVIARKALIQWRAMYPQKATDENFVFLKQSKEPITDSAIRGLIAKAIERAGVQKHVTPHTFRHSRITHMIQEGYPESVIKLVMWGSVEAPEFVTYAHLTGCDIDRAVLEKNGITTKEDNWKGIEGEICPYCNATNPPKSRYCCKCGRPLVAEDSVMELKKFLTNPAVVQALLESMNNDSYMSGPPCTGHVSSTFPGTPQALSYSHSDY